LWRSTLVADPVLFDVASIVKLLSYDIVERYQYCEGFVLGAPHPPPRSFCKDNIAIV